MTILGVQRKHQTPCIAVPQMLLETQKLGRMISQGKYTEQELCRRRPKSGQLSGANSRCIGDDWEALEKNQGGCHYTGRIQPINGCGMNAAKRWYSGLFRRLLCPEAL